MLISLAAFLIFIGFRCSRVYFLFLYHLLIKLFYVGGYLLIFKKTLLTQYPAIDTPRIWSICSPVNSFMNPTDNIVC